ncbi:DUF1661 domain-containing protein [Porphyromonas gingivalis]|nr:DUF1661 domain-containing protein [Porphyromonas gingivalis]
MAREVKISRAATKKFSRRFSIIILFLHSRDGRAKRWKMRSHQRER